MLKPSVVVLVVMVTAATVVSKELWIGTAPFCKGEARDCLPFDMEYVRSDRRGDGKWCVTGGKALCRSKPLPHSLVNTPAQEIAVATYNVFERPYVISHDGQRERTCHIPRALLTHSPELDVVIFAEAFMGGCLHDDKKMNMGALMTMYGFPYHTETVGASTSGLLTINGGVFIASRWPITATAQMEYSEAGHADRFSKKGAVYAKVEKLGRTYHIVGTHLQAQIGSSYDAIRVKQARELRTFISARGIPSTDPVLIGGDFNCDLNNNQKNTDDVIEAMNANLPEIVGDIRATYDHRTNDVVEPGNTALEWLDYVVPSRSHSQPTQSSLQAFRLTADKDITYCNSAPVQPYYVSPYATLCAKVKTTRHLSDHYPVVAKFTFGG